jgi:hypothetical protein
LAQTGLAQTRPELTFLFGDVVPTLARAGALKIGAGGHSAGLHVDRGRWCPRGHSHDHPTRTSWPGSVERAACRWLRLEEPRRASIDFDFLKHEYGGFALI